MVRTCQRGPELSLLRRKIYGGVIRAAYAAPGASAPLRNCEKVRAHQDRDGGLHKIVDPAEKRRAAGNVAADWEANLARRRHPSSAPAVLRQAEFQIAEAQRVALHLARASARWPAAGSRKVQQREVRARVEEARAQRKRDAAQRREAARVVRAADRTTHQWTCWRGVSRCATCFASAISWRGPCPGHADCSRTAIAAAMQQKHHLFVADAVDPAGARALLATCMHCGGWSMSGRSSKLAAPCLHAAAGAGPEVIRRIRRGRFPCGDARYRGIALEGLVPLGYVLGE